MNRLINSGLQEPKAVVAISCGTSSAHVNSHLLFELREREHVASISEEWLPSSNSDVVATAFEFNLGL